MAIRDWSTTAANNNAAVPDGFPEGMLPSGVNNSARELMAQVRGWYENPGWSDLGHTPTRVDNDTFTVATDLTATYNAGRRIKLVGATTGYATIASSSYAAPDTTVNVTMDSGNVPTSLTNVYIGFDTNTGIPLLGAANAFTGTALGLVNATNPYIYAQDSTNGVITKIQALDTSGVIGTESDHDLTIRTNNTARITIENDGAEIQLDATTLDFNGAAVDISGNLIGHEHIQGDQSAGSRFGWFDDADTFIHSAANFMVFRTGGSDVLSVSQAEIDLTATTLDFNGTVEFSGTVFNRGTEAFNYLVDTDAAANEGWWRLYASGTTFGLQTRTDVDGAGASPVVIARSGTTVSEIELNATDIDINANVDISGSALFGGNSATVQGNSPSCRYIEADAVADEKKWWQIASGGNFYCEAVDDAEGSVAIWQQVTRSGMTIDEIELNATTLDFNGAADISGTLAWGGGSPIASSNSFVSTSVDNTFSQSSNNIQTIETTNTSYSAIIFNTSSTGRGGVATPGASDQIVTGSLVGDLVLSATGRVVFGDGASTIWGFASAAEIELTATTLDLNGALSPDTSSVSSVGYLGRPVSDQSGNYTFLRADMGKMINYTGAGTPTFTIPANASEAFPVGTFFLVTVSGTGAVTIAITTDTLILAGVGTTGSRTLAPKGWAELYKITATSWLCHGPGVS
jgi:hypothetical protein